VTAAAAPAAPPATDRQGPELAGYRSLWAAAPADPAEDLVWVSTILRLVQEAVERSLVDEAAGDQDPGEA